MRAEFIDSLHHVDADSWNRCLASDYPFLQHLFLVGLEDTLCTTRASGWQPHHCLIWDQDQLVAAAPTYFKSHSYGEYVFDWAFADAWQRSGLQYYPKLLTAAPFTPCSGPRLLVRPDVESPADIRERLVDALCEEARTRASSWHVLFHNEPDMTRTNQNTLHWRQTCQFHWFNRNFADFDDFLATFSSRKRKSVKKERAKVAAQGITMVTYEGDTLTRDICQQFHHFYQMTYAKRSGHGGYLTAAFFTDLLPKMRESVVLVMAMLEGHAVAGALYLKYQTTLYGRYWGALAEFDALHFEACYYQGIDYCIQHGLQVFNPGAQGEHKIQRGFEPTLTQSHHFICDERFSSAVANFCEDERRQVVGYQKAASELLPFRSEP